MIQTSRPIYRSASRYVIDPKEALVYGIYQIC